MLLFLSSLLIFIKLGTTKIKYRYRFIKESEDIDILKNIGLNITFKQYKIVRLIIIIVLIVLLLIEVIFLDYFFSLNHILILILFIFFSSPKKSVFNIKMPLYLVVDYIVKEMNKKLDLEIYRAIIQIKNITIARKENISSDFVLEQIRLFSVRTKSIFNKVSSFWNLNEKENACNYLKKAINTKKSEMLSDILFKIDDTSSEDLLREINIYIENILKERETNLLKKYENQSYLVYALVSISLTIIILNFVILAGFFDVMNMLKEII